MFNRNIPNINEIEKVLPAFSDISFLAEGGQKFVYTGVNEKTKYALKLIPLYEEFDEDIQNTILKRAQREFNIMKEIDSPFFIKAGPMVPEIFEVEGHQYYCYSEILVEGKDVKELISERAFTVEESLTLGLQISSAILSLWSMQYIHRDIKPNNIMLKEDGNFVLLDAGVAYDLNDTSLTVGPQQPGTSIYMSPEQLVQSGREIDFRSDLFSLGVVLYEALTQRHPFFDNSLNFTQNMASILNSKAIGIDNFRDDLPKRFNRLIVTRLLAKRPHLRYRKCELIIQELSEIREEL